MKTAIAVIFTGLFLSACSSTDTSFIDEAKAQGAHNNKIVKKWEDAQEMVEDGESLVKKGKKKVSKARDMMDDGQEAQEKGQRMIQQGERLKAQVEDDYRLMQYQNGVAPSQYQTAPAPYYPE